MIYILLIIVLVLLVVCPLMLKKQKGARSAVTLVLVVAAVGLVIANTKNQTKPEPSPGSDTFAIHEIALTELGEILAADLPDGGKVLLFQMPAASEGIKKSSDAERLGLETGFGAAPFEIVAAQPASDQAAMAAPMEPVWSAEDILAALSEHADAAAVVTCVALPLDQVTADSLPPFYVFDGMGLDYWVEAQATGKVKVSIAPNEESPSVSGDEDPATLYKAMFKVHRAP